VWLRALKLNQWLIAARGKRLPAADPTLLAKRRNMTANNPTAANKTHSHILDRTPLRSVCDLEHDLSRLVRRTIQHAVGGARVGEFENLADRHVKRPAFDHRRDPVEPVARDVDDEIRRAHAFRPEIGLVRGAHDGDNDPVRAQRLAGDFECVAADRVDDSIERSGGQLRANAVAFHDGLGTQRPHAFEIPGARGPIDAGASFLRHLRRAGADAACRAAHQDRLSRFDPRVLEQHLPRRNGDDGKARRRHVVQSNLPEVPSVALGSGDVTLLEMTRAFAAIAKDTNRVDQYTVSGITKANRNLYSRSAPHAAQADGPLLHSEMMDLLSSVVRDGTGRAAQLDLPVAGKTGTSQDYRDAWFVGFTPDLVVGVWVGNDDNSPMKGVTGGSLPATIWHDFVKTAEPLRRSELS